MICNSIRDELMEKERRLVSLLDGSLSEVREKLIADVITAEANLHSVRIEEPKALTYRAKNRRSARELNERRARCVANLASAWKYGLVNFKNSHLDERLLQNLAGRIVLGKDRALQYRKGMVRPTGARVTPPDPEKMKEEMSRLLRVVNDYGVAEHPIDAALLLHYHLSRIHPFDDGNGRTARTLQNLILISRGFPLPVVSEGERFTYLSALRRADDGYRAREGKIDFHVDRVSPGERDFYKYMTGKVIASIDQLLDRPASVEV